MLVIHWIDNLYIHIQFTGQKALSSSTLFIKRVTLFQLFIELPSINDGHTISTILFIISSPDVHYPPLGTLEG